MTDKVVPTVHADDHQSRYTYANFAKFYGGLVIRLDRITDLNYWNDTDSFVGNGRGWSAMPPSTIRETLPESVSTDPKYTVPGPLGKTSSTPTNCFIFQIAATGYLGNSPVANGLVKIWRIVSPSTGLLASHHADNISFDPKSGAGGKPIVTADYNGGYGPFYLHGQTLNVPVLLNSVTSFSDSSDLALYTFGFDTVPFINVSKAKGVIVIIGNSGESWAYDMALPDLGWQVISGGSSSTYGGYRFGTDYSSVTSGKTTTVNCSGSDLNGGLSGFTLIVETLDEGGHTVTCIVNSAATPAPPASGLGPRITKSSTWENTRRTFEYPYKDRYSAVFHVVGENTIVLDSLTGPYKGKGIVQAWLLTESTTSTTTYGTPGGTYDVIDGFIGGIQYTDQNDYTQCTMVVSSNTGEPIPYLQQTSNLQEVNGFGATGLFSCFNGYDSFYGYAPSDIFTLVENPLGTGWTGTTFEPKYSYYYEGSYYQISCTWTIHSSSLGVTANYTASRKRILQASYTPAAEGVNGTVTHVELVDPDTTSASPASGSLPARTYHDYEFIEPHRHSHALRTSYTRPGTWVRDSNVSGVMGWQMHTLTYGSATWSIDVVDRNLNSLWQFNIIARLPGLDYSGTFTRQFRGFNTINTWTYGEGGYFYYDAAGSGYLYAAPYSQSYSYVWTGFFPYLDKYCSPVTLGSGWYNGLSRGGFLQGWVYGDRTLGTPVAPTPTEDDKIGVWNMNTPGTFVQSNLTVQDYTGWGNAVVPLDQPYNYPDILPNYAYFTTGLHWSLDLYQNFYGQMYGVDPRAYPDASMGESVIYVDPRTKGFIAQIFYDGTINNNADLIAACDLVIGNADGAVPLVNVLNEWLALQKINKVYDPKEVIISADTINSSQCEFL